MTIQPTKYISSPILALLSFLLIGLIIYWPATSGPFVFDDFASLSLLQLNGGINGFTNWWLFVSEGISSQVGRPLTLATFTLNGQTWPTSPLPFKVTNIVIHTFNAWLVYVLLKHISEIYNRNNSFKISNRLAFCGALIWLLHPIHLTSVLHVVQRMTLLGGTFTLIGLIVYSRYILNHRFEYNKPFVFLILNLALVGLLGILSKETVLLLPLYIFALNFTLFRQQLSQSKQSALYWQSALFFGPLLFLVLIYLVYIEQYTLVWERRDFSLLERLLTEARILMEYLFRIFVPKASGAGLFHDNYEVSKGLLSPVSTILSIIAIISLFLVAFWSRQKRPFLSLAILFFLLGHTLESTIIPLELYFEHRNYIPSLCLIFLMIQCALELKNKGGKILILLFTPYLALAIFVTSTSAFLWGDKLRLYTNWALENPNSIRAQHKAANTWLIDYASPIKARRFLIQALLSAPQSTGTRIKMLQMQCYFDQAPDDIKMLSAELDKTNIDWFYSAALSEIIALKEINKCDSLTLDFLIQIVSDLEKNPEIGKTAGLQWLYFHKAKLLHLNGELESALEYADKSSKLGAFIATSILKLEIATKLNNIELQKTYLIEAKSLETMQLNLIGSELKEKYDLLAKKIGTLEQ